MKMRFLRVLICSSVWIGIGALSADVSAQAQGSWTMKAPIPLARNEVALAAAGGKIHVIRSVYLAAGSLKPGAGAVTDQLIVFTMP